MKNILIITTLISGLIFTSLIKNKTRLLEKELLHLGNEINILSSGLTEASLDFQYLTTPKNISFLANNFLDENFSYYKESQIVKSIKTVKNVPEKDLAILKKSINNNTFNQAGTEELVNNKSNVAKEINNRQLLITKKNETQIAGDTFVGEETVKYLAILKKLINDNTFSQSVAEESVNNKLNVTKEIDNRQLQRSKKITTSKKVHNWAGLQILKSLFGIPAIPIK